MHQNTSDFKNFISTKELNEILKPEKILNLAEIIFEINNHKPAVIKGDLIKFRTFLTDKEFIKFLIEELLKLGNEKEEYLKAFGLLTGIYMSFYHQKYMENFDEDTEDFRDVEEIESNLKEFKTQLKEWIDKTNSFYYKADLYHYLYMFSLHDKEEALNNVYMELEFAKKTKKENNLWMAYFDLISFLIDSEDYIFAEEVLKEASQYIKNDTFYEFYGHLGILYYNEENYKKAEEMLEIVYQWLVFRTMDESIEYDEGFNTNMFYFLYILATIYEEKKEIEKSIKILSFSKEMMVSKFEKIFFFSEDMYGTFFGLMEDTVEKLSLLKSKVLNVPKEKIFEEEMKNILKHEEINNLRMEYL